MDRAIESAITTALMTYCRGVDRLHADDIVAAFHPDAELHYGPSPTTARAFAELVCASLAEKYTSTQHRISNIRIEPDGTDDGGDRYRVETYILAYHVVPDRGEGRELLTFCGRYLDTFVERDGRWGISHRLLLCDWSARDPLGPEMGGRWAHSGRGEVPDPIYG
ncbi:MAG: nuclear transport factor 2 family protein [Actinomycetota bacterium]